MTQIKICGITNVEDAALAAELGVDALGFIFSPKSPRYIAPEHAKAIIDKLTEIRPVIVGIFVNEKAAAVKETAAICGLDMIQLHGDESPQYCEQFPDTRLIKALTPDMEKDLNSLARYPVQAYLIDSRDAGRYGGTGRQSDWSQAKIIAQKYPLIVAGGLREDNIRNAIMTVSPHALDLNSGIESAPGKKDAGKMCRIVEIIRTEDNPVDDRDIKIFSHLQRGQS